MRLLSFGIMPEGRGRQSKQREVGRSGVGSWGALISHEGDRVLRTGDRTAGRVWVTSGELTSGG